MALWLLTVHGPKSIGHVYQQGDEAQAVARAQQIMAEQKAFPTWKGPVVSVCWKIWDQPATEKCGPPFPVTVPGMPLDAKFNRIYDPGLPLTDAEFGGTFTKCESLKNALANVQAKLNALLAQYYAGDYPPSAGQEISKTIAVVKSQVAELQARIARECTPTYRVPAYPTTLVARVTGISRPPLTWLPRQVSVSAVGPPVTWIEPSPMRPGQVYGVEWLGDLQDCSQACYLQYGAKPDGSPATPSTQIDPLKLMACFAQCDAQNLPGQPPAVPPGGFTIPAGTTLPGGLVIPQGWSLPASVTLPGGWTIPIPNVPGTSPTPNGQGSVTPPGGTFPLPFPVPIPVNWQLPAAWTLPVPWTVPGGAPLPSGVPPPVQPPPPLNEPPQQTPTTTEKKAETPWGWYAAGGALALLAVGAAVMASKSRAAMQSNPTPSKNVYWRDIKPGDAVEFKGHVYVVTKARGGKAVAYWEGREAREAQRFLEARRR